MFSQRKEKTKEVKSVRWPAKMKEILCAQGGQEGSLSSGGGWFPGAVRMTVVSSRRTRPTNQGRSDVSTVRMRWLLSSLATLKL